LLIALVIGCVIFQVVSAGGMAKVAKFSNIETLTIGIGMTGRTEMAFILAAIGLNLNVISDTRFSILIFATCGLKWCVVLLKRKSNSTL
jgi:Kef-type K+ transport system membrane component KefB